MSSAMAAAVPALGVTGGKIYATADGRFTFHVVLFDLEVLERSRYTVTLSLTYHLKTDDGLILDPDITVRAYLDGHLAEAMMVGNRQRHMVLRKFLDEHKRELDLRWRRNIVLNKWLEYLSDQGHLILDR